jgi:hypothetical protein
MPLKFPALPKLGSLPRPPRDRGRKPVRPTGPDIYHRGSEPIIDSPFMHPPGGFVTAHTSGVEWMCFLALAILNPGFPEDPFSPPFIGGPPIWVYQKHEQGGRVAGGSVSDFVVLSNSGAAKIGIRVETERFHIWTDSGTQQKDIYIAAHLETVNKIVRVYDQHFVDDPTGEKVTRIMALAMKGIELPSPVTMGTAQRVRP